jgi:hypothetical protein
MATCCDQSPLTDFCVVLDASFYTTRRTAANVRGRGSRQAPRRLARLGGAAGRWTRATRCTLHADAAILRASAKHGCHRS